MDSGLISTIMVFILPFLGGMVLMYLIMVSVYKERFINLYRSGFNLGIKNGVEMGAEDAVQRERMRVARELHDGGRRYMPRSDAGNARIHKAQIANRMMQRPDNQL